MNSSLLRECILLVGVCLIAGSSMGQTKSSEVGFESSKFGVQAGILPLLFVNTVHVGLTLNGDKVEHILSSETVSTYFYYPSYKSTGGTYSLNLKLNRTEKYIPIWFRSRFITRQQFPGSWFYPNYRFERFLNFTLGTGIGNVYSISKNLGIRSEFCFGVTYRLVDEGYAIDSKKLGSFQPDFFILLPAVRVNLRLLYRL